MATSSTGRSKAEIQRDLNNARYQRNVYQSNVNQLNKALDKAKDLLNKLKNTLGYLTSSQDNLKKYFTINGKTIDGGKIDSSKEKINQILKKLNNTIIPAIIQDKSTQQRKVDDYKRRINNLEYEYRVAVQ